MMTAVRNVSSCHTFLNSAIFATRTADYHARLNAAYDAEIFRRTRIVEGLYPTMDFLYIEIRS